MTAAVEYWVKNAVSMYPYNHMHVMRYYEKLDSGREWNANTAAKPLDKGWPYGLHPERCMLTSVHEGQIPAWLNCVCQKGK